MVTKPGDPEYNVFQDVLKWHNTIECIPTWDEMLEYEYVRQRGDINMITENVQRYAFDKGLYALVNWFERCKEARISPWKLYDIALKKYQAEHGPREKWITDDLREEVELRELREEEFQIRRRLQQLNEIKARKSAITKRSKVK